jgi:hypothetical protein
MDTIKISSLLSAMLLSLAASAQTDAIKLRIDGNNYFDETIIRFVSDATEGFDGNYDAWKLFSYNTQVPSLYTQIDSVSPLSINALPALAGKTVVDVHANVNVAGVYMITPTEVGPFQPGICITLEEIATGNYYDMRSGVTPSFSLPPGNNNGQPRFRLHFSTPVSLTVTDALCYNASDGKVMLDKAGSVNWTYSLADSTGSIVAAGSGISEGDTVTGLPAGNYTLTSMAPFGCPETVSFHVDQPGSLEPSFVPSDSIAYQSSAAIHFSNTTTSASAFTWDFGDGSPVDSQVSPSHTYLDPGSFTVTLTASDGTCHETASRTISILPDVTTGIAGSGNNSVDIYANDNLLIIQGLEASRPGRVSVFDLSGRQVMEGQVIKSPEAAVDLHLRGGFYLVKLQQGEEIFIKKVFVGGQ